MSALFLLFAGPGPWSIDGWLARSRNRVQTSSALSATSDPQAA
jgi:hypothetical protein